jgi:predicted Zn-dependent protease
MVRWIVLALIVLTAVVALLLAARRDDVVRSGPAALAGWIGEAQHELARVPAAAGRLSDDEERRIGDSMARGAVSPPSKPEDLAMARTVSRIGERLAPHAHRRLPYRFHYLAAPGLVNAFALPGGHVVIASGLVAKLETEDQLAAIIGHELAHVDRYHCAERVLLEAAARRLPLGSLVTLPVALFQAGYGKTQELEADRAGTVMAVRAGYSPLGAVHAFEVLVRLATRAERRAPNPVAEAADASLQSLQVYLQSHPDPLVRRDAIEALIRSEGWVPAPERRLERTVSP